MRYRDIISAYFMAVGGVLSAIGHVLDNERQVITALFTLAIGVILFGMIQYDDYRG